MASFFLPSPAHLPLSSTSTVTAANISAITSLPSASPASSSSSTSSLSSSSLSSSSSSSPSSSSSSSFALAPCPSAHAPSLCDVAGGRGHAAGSEAVAVSSSSFSSSSSSSSSEEEVWEMREEAAVINIEEDISIPPAAAAEAGERGLFSKHFLPKGTIILSSQTPLTWIAACSSNTCCCSSSSPTTPHNSSNDSSSSNSSSSRNNGKKEDNQDISLLHEKHRADQLTPCAYCLAPPNHVTSSYPTYRMQQGSRSWNARGKALRCSGCKCTFYCSPACQRDAWPEHRKECPIFHTATAATAAVSASTPAASAALQQGQTAAEAAATADPPLKVGVATTACAAASACNEPGEDIRSTRGAASTAGPASIKETASTTGAASRAGATSTAGASLTAVRAPPAEEAPTVGAASPAGAILAAGAASTAEAAPNAETTISPAGGTALAVTSAGPGSTAEAAPSAPEATYPEAATRSPGATSTGGTASTACTVLNAGAVAPAVMAMPCIGRATKERIGRVLLTERQGEKVWGSGGEEEVKIDGIEMISPAAAAHNERDTPSALDVNLRDAGKTRATEREVNSIAEQQRALLHFEQQLKEFVDIFMTTITRAAAAATKAAADAADARTAADATIAAHGKVSAEATAAAGAKPAAGGTAAADGNTAADATTAAEDGKAAAAAVKAAPDARAGAEAAAHVEPASVATAVVSKRQTAAGGGEDVNAKYKKEGASAAEDVTGNAPAARAGRTVVGGEKKTAAAAAAIAERATAMTLFAKQVHAAGSAVLMRAAAKVTRNAIAVLLSAEEGEICCSTTAAANWSCSRRESNMNSCQTTGKNRDNTKSSNDTRSSNSISSSNGSSNTRESYTSGSREDRYRDRRSSSSIDIDSNTRRSRRSSSSRGITKPDNSASGNSKCSCCFRGSQCAVGLYPPPLCWANHACSSNAVLLFGAAPQRLSVSLVATRDIQGGEEILICYTPRMQLQQQRRRMLLSVYGFICRCALCFSCPRLPPSEKQRQQTPALQQSQQQQRAHEQQRKIHQERPQDQQGVYNVEKKTFDEKEFEKVEKKRLQQQPDPQQQQVQGSNEEQQQRKRDVNSDVYGCEEEEFSNTNRSSSTSRSRIASSKSSTSNSSSSVGSTSNSTSNNTSNTSSSSSSSSTSCTKNSSVKKHEEEGCCPPEAFDMQLMCLFCPSPSCVSRCFTPGGDVLLMLDTTVSERSAQEQQNVQVKHTSEHMQHYTVKQQHQVPPQRQKQQHQLHMPVLLVYERDFCDAEASNKTSPRARETTITNPRVIVLEEEDAGLAECAAISLSDICSRIRRGTADSRHSTNRSSSGLSSTSRVQQARQQDSSTRSSCPHSATHVVGSHTVSSNTEFGNNTYSTAKFNRDGSNVESSVGRQNSSSTRRNCTDTFTRTRESVDRRSSCGHAGDTTLEGASLICNTACNKIPTDNTSNTKDKDGDDCPFSIRCAVCKTDVSVDVVLTIQAAYSSIEEAFAAFLDGKPDTHMAAAAAAAATALTLNAGAAALGRDAAAWITGHGTGYAAEKRGCITDVANAAAISAIKQFSSSWLQFYLLLHGYTHPGNRYLYHLREQFLLPSLLAYRDFYVPSALLLAIHQTRAAVAAHGQWTEEVALALEREGRLLLAIAQDAKSTTGREAIEAAIAYYVWQIAEERMNLLHHTVGSNILKDKLSQTFTETLSLAPQQQHRQQGKHVSQQLMQDHKHMLRQQGKNMAEELLIYSCKSLTRACTIRRSLHTAPASHTRELERTLYDCRAELQDIYREIGGGSHV